MVLAHELAHPGGLPDRPRRVELGRHLSRAEEDEILAKLASAVSAGIGTPTLAETGIVLASRLRNDPRDLLVRLLGEFGIAEVPFGDEHWREAADAYLRFGRGRHKAQLNFGDCLTYAVARLANEPLPFAGNDFAATDLDLA